MAQRANETRDEYDARLDGTRGMIKTVLTNARLWDVEDGGSERHRRSLTLRVGQSTYLLTIEDAWGDEDED